MAVQDSRLLRVIDLAGTFVLAIQGASIGAEKGLDFLGVMVISLVTAMGGGIARDLLVVEHPPEACLRYSRSPSSSGFRRWLCSRSMRWACRCSRSPESKRR